MEKSPEAFRTISEVADLLDTPAHVLRFWESRFPQIRPVKRAGGRRYYRPGDVALLSGIKRLLHDDGMTIRGVQKILREHGVRHVAGLSGTAEPDPLVDDVEAVFAAEFGPLGPLEQTEPAAAQTAQIISLERALARAEPEQDSAPSQSDITQDAPVEIEQAPDAPFWAEDGDDVGSGTVAGAAEDESLQTDTAGAQSSDTAVELQADDLPLSSILRRTPKAALMNRKAELALLHGRLLDLRERLAQASRRRAR